MDEHTKQDSPAIRGLLKSNVWDHENAFYWFSHPTRINKMLAHYELYKSIVDLPGDIFELGIYKAASLIRLATFRNLLENDFSRKIVGFDAFGKFPVDNITLKIDLDFIEAFESTGGEGLSLQEVKNIFKDKNFQNVLLNEGNVFETLPEFLENYPATRIALLHLDMDVKEPTFFALELLYERVVPGGLIVLDDYNSVAGATDAVDEFLKKHHLKIEKTSHYYVPSFIRKPL
ncbi:TylF/MycF/NovP-related O-methyltransferase [Hydrogenophaga sp. PAMC20947]|uniref:TylF/MycF/NovP-related O-methyltransferase n=1 Tax=Hydrogenophaga sp. PAMC20947 TaxID=2565558 RepID=UPI00109DA5E8|nr:TylF/MycF/NovP-related O-methyltransferase [Hydrogenophaga sp. PAMC20947]QCB46805.1 dTDP-6-deoxy-L-hexose 3-O-methyltransferase [Hydrogenophaga sp. PAMC20947]